MRRSTVILLIIFVLLGTLVWYMQRPGNQIEMALATATATQSESSGTLIDPNRGPINLISIQAASGKTVSIDKSSGKWKVKVDQEDVPTDQNLADSVAGQALDLQIVKQFETAPDPAGTGLDKPVYNIALKLADGSLFKFNIGKATVTDSGYYASTEDGKVYILNKSTADTLIFNFAQPPILKTATPSPGPETETPVPGATASATP
jgi:outer membrane protein assembly factor BamB